MAITHAKVSAIGDGGDASLVRPSDWNANHVGECTGTVPIGAIIIWSGTIATIPGGYALCDGTANAPGPDLRDVFIVGAKQDDGGVPKTNITGALTSTGGAVTHDHDATNAAVSAHSLSTNVAIDAHSLSTSVAVSAHSLSTNVALSAHSLTTDVAIANHTLTTSQGRTSSASSRAFVTTTSLTHTITQPVVADHNITQPVVSNHSITQPVVANHSITQPVVANHSITQPTISSESNLPPYYALAYIQRMS
jgi:hypothetical protein